MGQVELLQTMTTVIIGAPKNILPDLMVMSFAVGESLLLVVSGAEKGFFALGADKVLHMPLFAERVDHAIFNRSSASTANRNAHLQYDNV